MIKLTDCRSVEEAFNQAGLWWYAQELGLITSDLHNITSHKAIVRSDDHKKVLGIVGKGYQIIQNHEAFSIMDVLSQRHRAVFKYCGIIDEGRKVVLQAKVGNAFDVRPGDSHEKFITAVNSFDGSSSVRIYFSAVRLFCMNQLNLSWRKRELSVSVKHTGNAESHIKEAFQIFNISNDYFSNYKEKASYLCRKIVNKNMVERFLDQVIGEAEFTRKKNQRERVEQLFVYGKGNGRGTAYDLVNGLTEWVDHERSKDNLDSRLLGSGAALKSMAFDTALAL
ncbi:MAG: DUF932 domain-containing protein [bacterium]